MTKICSEAQLFLSLIADTKNSSELLFYAEFRDILKVTSGEGSGKWTSVKGIEFLQVLFLSH